MSGTSLDGIDAVCCDFRQSNAVSVVGSYSTKWPEGFREVLLRLASDERVDLNELTRTHFALASMYAAAVSKLLVTSKLGSEDITAIGLHGQTVRHLPVPDHLTAESKSAGTLQLGSGTALAALSGIDVIWDMRAGDVALGGQGAPLVPMFDLAFLQSQNVDRLAVNIGGIANVTWIPVRGEVLAYDCGPGNMILDLIAQNFLERDFDPAGKTARGGSIDDDRLHRIRMLPFFLSPPPKSTGRELFGELYEREFAAPIRAGALTIEDALRTAVELTARAIVDAIPAATTSCEIIVSGGGTMNTFLIDRLRQLTEEHASILRSDDVGIPSQLKEAIAFAYFANAFLDKRFIHLPHTTGASRKILLGSHASGKSQKN